MNSWAERNKEIVKEVVLLDCSRLWKETLFPDTTFDPCVIKTMFPYQMVKGDEI